MLEKNLEKTNEKAIGFAYLNNKRVLIVQNIEILGMSKVKYLGEDECFFINHELLTKEKQNEKTLCIKLCLKECRK